MAVELGDGYRHDASIVIVVAVVVVLVVPVVVLVVAAAIPGVENG